MPPRSLHKMFVRQSARAARLRLTPEARAESSRGISERRLALPELASASSVLSYSALPEEADPAEALAAMRARGVRTGLPRISGPASLDLHWVDDSTSLVPGPYGIMEPAHDAPPASIDDFEAVIVPGVAFDRTCARVGFGGGYYDALLSKLRDGVATVAVAFDEQIVDKVPCEDHDMRVDVIVTPSAVYRAAG
jgi:5-formyltetrahydrofolate cyclo-ligase